MTSEPSVSPAPSRSSAPPSWAAVADALAVGLLATGPDHVVLLANRAATDLLDPAPAGRDLLDVLAAARPPVTAADLDAVARDRVPLQRSVLLRHGRSTVRREVRVVAIPDGEGVAGLAVQIAAAAGATAVVVAPPARTDEAPEPAGELTVGRVSVDLTTRVVRIEGRPDTVRLTGREFELLRELMRHPGQLRSRAGLLRAVWSIDFPTSTSVVDVTMSRLRHKTGLSELSTHRSDGYAFDVVPAAPKTFGPTVVAQPVPPPAT